MVVRSNLPMASSRLTSEVPLNVLEREGILEVSRWECVGIKLRKNLGSWDSSKPAPSPSRESIAPGNDNNCVN